MRFVFVITMFVITLSVGVGVISSWSTPLQAQVAPMVVMANKLKNTHIGRVISRRLEKLVGKQFSYTYEHHGQVYTFSGKLKSVVVPDISRLDKPFSQSEFRGQFGEVVAVGDHQGIGQSGMMVGEVPFSDIREDLEIGAVAYIKEADSLLEPAIGRLVGKYLDTYNGGTFHEILVELSERDAWNVVEPRIVLVDEQSDTLEVISR